MKIILTGIITVLMLTNCSCDNEENGRYTVYQDGKIIGVSDSYYVRENGCKSYLDLNGTVSRVCGSFNIKNEIYEGGQ